MSQPLNIATTSADSHASIPDGRGTSRRVSNPPLDALDQLSDGYYEVDREFRYTRLNATGARLMRLEPEQVLGRTVLELFPELETSTVHAAVRRVMAGGPSEHVEIY